MTLPDWLVERAALDEVEPHRDRIAQADPNELATRIATLRTDNAAELASYPPGPALRQIEARIAAERKQHARRRRQLSLLGLATSAAALVLVARFVIAPSGEPARGTGPTEEPEITRVKGTSRLLVFRQAGDHAERLTQDTLVHAGDVLQLRYNGGGHAYGVIASIDGAGVVTLHHPASEDAPAAATALAADTAALPNAYALDDAPRFERFFFIVGDQPIDVQHSLDVLRTFAHRGDSATASLELPSDLHQWSLRLRKPDPTQNP